MGWTTAGFASTGTAGAAIGAGVMGYEAAQDTAAQYKFNAKSERIAADEDSAQRLSDLNSTISAINAVRTSHGLDLASPTGLAITQGVTKRAESNIATARLNYLTKAQSDLFGAQDADLTGQAALLGGFLNAGQQIGDTAASGGFG